MLPNYPKATPFLDYLAEARKLAAVEGAVSPSLPASPAPPPAPPCTVDMLKQRPAGDKSWPIKCRGATLSGVDKDLVLSGAHLSYGDFKEAMFVGTGAIRLNETGLAHADLSGAKVSVFGENLDGNAIRASIDFSGANLTNADLSGSMFTAESSYAASGASTIDFSGAHLAHANLSGSTFSASSSYGGGSTIDFSGADLAHTDLSSSAFTADNSQGSYGKATIDFSEANLANADLSDLMFIANSSYGDATIDFSEANFTNADVSGSKVTAEGKAGDATINFTKADFAYADLRGSEVTAKSTYGKTTIDSTQSKLSDAGLIAENILGLQPQLPPVSPPPSHPPPLQPPSSQQPSVPPASPALSSSRLFSPPPSSPPQGDATMFALYIGGSIVAAGIFAACCVAWRRRLKKTRLAWSGKVDPTLTFSGSSASEIQIDLPHLAPDSAYTAASRAPDKGVLLDGTTQLCTGMEWYR